MRLDTKECYCFGYCTGICDWTIKAVPVLVILSATRLVMVFLEEVFFLLSFTVCFMFYIDVPFFIYKCCFLRLPISFLSSCGITRYSRYSCVIFLRNFVLLSLYKYRDLVVNIAGSVVIVDNQGFILIMFSLLCCETPVKVFRINPEFRILRLTFHMESQPQYAELCRLYM